MSEDILRDAESVCFDCGSTDDLKVMSPGVALCAKCRAEEQEFRDVADEVRDE